MRIALVTETFLPKVDGIVNTLCRLLEHLEERGHASFLIAPQGGPDRFAATPVLGVPGLRVPFYPELRLALPHDLSAPLAEFQPEVVHVLNPLALGVAGLSWARRAGVPVVASYHTDLPGFAAQWGLGALRPAIWAATRLVHNQFDLTLSPSRITQTELRRHGFERVQVWGRGVDGQLFSPGRRTAALRQRLSGGRPEAPLLLYAGRLSREKRVDWLRPVLDGVPEARLMIVGDGPERSALEALFAGTATTFLGYLRGGLLAEVYAAADVFVFPGANETLGNVVLEAMASGLPVVAPRSGGLLDHVEHGRHGLLFEPDDAADCVQRVQQLVHHPEWARALGAAGRRHAESATWPAALDGLLTYYTTLIQRRARLPRLKRPRWAISPPELPPG